MISSEVTILFEKACQSASHPLPPPQHPLTDPSLAVFIQELTTRAHLVSLSAKRRTISRADVAQAVSRSDMFDFLIVRGPARDCLPCDVVRRGSHKRCGLLAQDIVPRTERPTASTSHTPAADTPTASGSGTRSRPSRTRRHSQRESPAVEEEDEEEEEQEGERELDVEENGHVGKRRRQDDVEQGHESGEGEQHGAVDGLDMTAAADVGGYYLPGMGDPAVREASSRRISRAFANVRSRWLTLSRIACTEPLSAKSARLASGRIRLSRRVRSDRASSIRRSSTARSRSVFSYQMG